MNNKTIYPEIQVLKKFFEIVTHPLKEGINIENFNNGDFNSFIGYHEFLYQVSEERKKDLHISAFPSNERPIIMVDALVKRKGFSQL
jgi:hypothetical protein